MLEGAEPPEVPHEYYQRSTEKVRTIILNGPDLLFTVVTHLLRDCVK